MSDSTQLQTSMWLLILIQTIGAIDMPTKGSISAHARKLPAPRMYVAVVIAWSVLGVIADAGYGRAAAVMGWVTVATAMFVGGFSTIATGFLNAVASRFGTSPSQQPLPSGVTQA